MKDEVLERIVANIDRAIRPKQIYLFGSRAKGTAREDSDYDILVIYDGPLDKDEALLKITRQFERHDFSMDVIILRSEEFEWQKNIVTTVANEVIHEGALISE